MKQLQKVIKQLTAIIELLAAEKKDKVTDAAIRGRLHNAQIDLLKASNSIIGGDDSGGRGGGS